MEATSRWYTVTKSHQSSPGPKRFTIQRTGSCELICQFIRQRNSHWATRALLIYIYIYSSFSQTLSSFSLSLSLYMRFFLSGGHVYLLDPVPWLYRRRYLFERRRRRRRQPSGTSNEHFWVVWRERRARYRSWGSQLDEIRTITSFLPSLKEPWNWKGSLSRCHREEGGCPFSPTIGEIKGARAVSRESGLRYEPWIVNTHTFGSSAVVFYPREEFRRPFIDWNYWFTYERSDPLILLFVSV